MNDRSIPARHAAIDPCTTRRPFAFRWVRPIPRAALITLAYLMAAGGLASSARGQACFDWTARTGPTARGGHVMAYDSARGVVVMYGATLGSSGSETETWEWTGDAWHFRTRQLPETYLSSAGCMDYDSARQVTVMFLSTSTYTRAQTWEWDGLNWSVRATTGPDPRRSSSMVFDRQRGVMVLFGGEKDGEPLGDTWTWDGVQWTLVNTGGPSPRSQHRMVYDSRRNVIVLFGGYTDTLSGETWEWDGASWTLITSSGPSPRRNPAMAFDAARGTTVLFGGRDDTYDNETWEYDGVAWALRSTENSPSPRSSSMAFDESRSVCLLFGGVENTEERVNAETWEWDGIDWRRQPFPGDVPKGRGDHAMAFDSARGVSVMFGGGRDCREYCNNADYPTYLGDTWEWDGVHWLLRDAGEGGPGARAGHAMAFDDRRGVVVLFGGKDGDGDIRGDTWEWDGVAWQLRTTAGPYPRFRAAMAYDSQRGVVVLFGGRTTQYYRDQWDTWEWDGTSWTERPVSGPQARFKHAMTYDRTRGVMVLYGGAYDGRNGYDYLLDDTHEFDGSTWTERETSSPPGRRSSAGFDFDPDSGFSFLFAGTDGGWPAKGDVWAWDGRSWIQRTVDGPSNRFRLAMVFDSARSSFVTFGGFASIPGLHPNDTWEGFEDCNCNGRLDREDLEGGLEPDCNGNGKIDACDVAFGIEPDCNGNLLIDDCELEDGTAPDCNGNQHIDECDMAEGTSPDCNANVVPDECDLAEGTSQDCNLNLEPDECDIAEGTSTDCDLNSVPDECQPMVDCDNNGVFDACDVLYFDCNRNGVPDKCDLAEGTSQDCNENFVPDECDIERGIEPDHNRNGVPDRCEPCGLVETGEATCELRNNGRRIVRATIDFDLPRQTVVEACLDGGDCKRADLDYFGATRFKWKRVAAGEHEVCLGDCPELNLCWQATCP